MSNLIEATEFGDWLLGEISDTGKQSQPAGAPVAPTASVRREALQVAKQVLLEFLILQQAMLNAATARRQQS